MGYLQKLSYCSETLDITSEGFGEMSEGDSADTWAGKFPLMSMGAERTVKRAQTVSENPHRHTIEAILTKAANFVLEHFRTRILKIYTDLPWGPKE